MGSSKQLKWDNMEIWVDTGYLNNLRFAIDMAMLHDSEEN